MDIVSCYPLSLLSLEVDWLGFPCGMTQISMFLSVDCAYLISLFCVKEKM